MRTVVTAVAAVAFGAALMGASVLTSAPALAQRGMGRMGGAPKSAPKEDPEAVKRKNAAAEKAYQAAVERTPDKKYDPWGGVRK